MHALSKKHYYDVMKSGQEDTILESDTSNEDCVREDTPTSDVACYARAHLKSNSVQTYWNRNNKNFRNECTLTSDEDSGAVALDTTMNVGGCFIYHSRSCEDLATIRSRSSQATSTSHQQHPKIDGTFNDDSCFPRKTAVIVERAVDFFQQTNGLALESKATITVKGDDESTQYECVQSKMRISDSDEYQCMPSNRGLAACRPFSLGSPESRRFQNEHCKTKLIGGCRVPVCKNYKSRF